VRCLNENLIDGSKGLYEALYSAFTDNGITLSDKERFVISNKPTIYLVQNALLTYKTKSAAGYFTAILAFFMETAEFPIDFYNEYSLSLGRQSQGVTLFKNGMISMVDKSKKVPTKPEISDALKETNITQVFSLHSNLFDKANQYYL